MASQCAICQKRRNKANSVSFSNKHNPRFQQPNLQRCKVILQNGTHTTLRVCTSCIRAGKVRKAS